MRTHINHILITGPLGWLGSRLVEALAMGLPGCPAFAQPLPGLRIRCMVQPDQNPAPLHKLPGHIECVIGDIRNSKDCEQFVRGASGAILIHTAGIIHPKRVADFFAINRDGTEKLLDAAIGAGIRRAVVVSSNSPCGCNPHPDHLFDEHSTYSPYMGYGRSKMEMERMVIAKQDQIETVIIRAPWFYGPNHPARQTQFFEMIRDGKMPIVGNGNNLRSMAYVDNLCQGLMLAASTQSAAGGLYWIADKRPYSMNEIIDTVERLLESEFAQKCTHKRIRLPGVVSKLAWLVDRSIQSVGLYNQKVHVLSEMNKTIACSVAKAQSELGYHPTVALEEGMRRSLQWMRRNGMLT